MDVDVEKIDQFSGEDYFLLIRLEENQFAISFKNLVKVLPKVSYTQVPAVPDFIRGIINYKGELIPLIDAKRMLNITKLGLENEENLVITKNSLGDTFIAFYFDSKGDIIIVDSEKIDINKDPDEKNVFWGEFILDKKIISIIDFDKFINKFTLNKE